VFGKKKAIEVKNISYQCQVPGCGLICTDDVSMNRHMNWAHQEVVSSDKQTQTPNSRKKNN
jgi:uncharacterized C2H2 Zn-finger protein